MKDEFGSPAGAPRRPGMPAQAGTASPGVKQTTAMPQTHQKSGVGGSGSGDSRLLPIRKGTTRHGVPQGAQHPSDPKGRTSSAYGGAPSAGQPRQAEQAAKSPRELNLQKLQLGPRGARSENSAPVGPGSPVQQHPATRANPPATSAQQPANTHAQPPRSPRMQTPRQPSRPAQMQSPGHIRPPQAQTSPGPRAGQVQNMAPARTGRPQPAAIPGQQNRMGVRSGAAPPARAQPPVQQQRPGVVRQTPQRGAAPAAAPHRNQPRPQQQRVSPR